MKTEFRFQRNLRPFFIRDFDVAGGADPFDHLRDRLLIPLHLISTVSSQQFLTQPVSPSW